jgi:L-ascorbate metabolism protein UlaG (beta-lactamase superfamily)
MMIRAFRPAPPSLLAGLFVLVFAWSPAVPAPVDITFLANEGFMIASEDKGVLIDGLFRKGVPGYGTVPPEWREKLETAEEPFNEIDIILVSHWHADHFDPEAIKRYLSSNPQAILISSKQVVGSMAKVLGDQAALHERVRAVSIDGDKHEQLTIAGIGLEIQAVTHGTGRFASIENLGHIVTIGDKRILHIGDSDAGDEDLERLRWSGEPVDIAFVPYWYLINERRLELVKKHIRADHIIAAHVPPDDLARIKGQLKEAFPDAIVFDECMEKRRFN